MPSRTTQLSQEAPTERSPLLLQRESTLEYVTHVAEDAPVADIKHYNLAGMSQFDFWALCISMWSCAFLSAFDGTIVAILLGTISSSFNALNMASWLGTAYLLSVSCFTPLYGRLCDIFGRQASLLIALSFFTVGNIMCAVAPTMNAMILARAIAGIGGGGLTSVASTITSDLVPITHRGIFQGYANILFGLGSGLGAPIGGIISDNLGWRWAFYLQVPMLVLAGTMIFFKVRYTIPSPSNSGSSTPVLKETTVQKLKKVDWLGSFILACSIGSILMAVSLKTSSIDEATGFAWSDPTIVGLFVAGAVSLVLFLAVELKFAVMPILPVELLTQRTPVAVAINNLSISILSFGVMYTVPLYFTAVRLMTPSVAGYHLIPNSVLGALGSLGNGFLVRHTGKYYWLTFFSGCFAVISSCMLSTWDLDTSEWSLWTAFGPMAFSLGSVSTLTIVGLIADIGREHVAVATSLSYMFRTTGQVLGVSLSGALTQAILQRELPKRITGPDAPELIAQIRRSSDVIRQLPPALQLAATQSYQKGLQAVFICSIVFAVIGVISALGMREVDMSPAAYAAKNRSAESDEEQS